MSGRRAGNSGTGPTQLWTKPQLSAAEPTRRTHGNGLLIRRFRVESRGAQHKRPGQGGSSDLSGVQALVGSRSSPNAPVRLAGVEHGSVSVALEVAEAEADALDPFDQVIERLGGPVAHPGQGEIDDPFEPLADRLSELLDLGRHGALHTVGHELFEHGVGVGEVGRGVEVTEPFFHPIRNGHLRARSPERDQRLQSARRPFRRASLRPEQDAASPEERIVSSTPMPSLFGLHPKTDACLERPATRGPCSWSA